MTGIKNVKQSENSHSKKYLITNNHVINQEIIDGDIIIEIFCKMFTPWILGDNAAIFIMLIVFIYYRFITINKVEEEILQLYDSWKKESTC